MSDASIGLGDAEAYYLPGRSRTARAPVGETDWDFVSDLIAPLRDYQITHGPSYGLFWAEALRRGADHPGPALFKIFLSMKADAPRPAPRRRRLIRAAVEALILFRVYRLKICTDGRESDRPDGIVLYLSAEQIAAVCAFLYGSIPQAESAGDAERPTFSMPFPATGPSAVSYVQGERFENGRFHNPDWAGTAEIFSSRELRALAYSRSGGGPLEYDPAGAARMEEFGFHGDRYHLVVGTPDPVRECPSGAWQGYLLALHHMSPAREPDKLASVEALTGIGFGEAIFRGVADARPAPGGSQRKILLGLECGAQAIFRPDARRLASHVKDYLAEVGLAVEVAPFWLRRMKACGDPLTPDGFEALYERDIGRPRLEVAAWKLCAALGSDLLPPVARGEWNGEPGSVQMLMRTIRDGDDVPIRTRQLERDLEEADLLDTLLDNRDRPDNWEVTPDGRVLLIDNTQVFGAPGKYARAGRPAGSRYRAVLLDAVARLAREGIGDSFGTLLTDRERRELEDRLKSVAEYLRGVLDDLTRDEARIED